MMLMIETRDLRRSFTSKTGTVEAVKGVDLNVDTGEVFGFLGPNGAGKTTTLRMLSTLLPPSGGEARVAGCDLLREPKKVRERIGYVGQLGGADPNMTGRKELEFQARIYGANSKLARTRAAEIIDMLELEACADRPTSTYSGGQRRRLDIGLGLIHRPRLVFLDEPTTGLDPQARARLWNEIRRLKQGGVTVFLTTHYLEEADALCDRLSIIDHGLIVAEGTPEQLKREIAGDVITLGLDGDRDRALELLRAQPYVRQATTEAEGVRLYVDRGDAAMPSVLRLLDGAGLQLQTIAMSRPSLDDVFLQQTGHTLRDSAAPEPAVVKAA
jgi:ABC-2 type transport system ATP-binding protein